ncbi:MAG: tRNA (adenosine(37)-N6)-threonylcarbamoyltransferase complex dimerization subunit type 1 TsaB, partial [Nocardioidaceae bacterium]
MLLLALDTATPAVTVALYDADGDRVLAAADQLDARRHGELLLPSVDRVLGEASRTLTDVGRLVVGVGPGPYTGLRVGLATAEAFGA